MHSLTFAYDGAGNPTTWQGQTRTFNSNNQETTGNTSSVTNFGYNGDGSPWKYLNRNLKTTQNPNGTPQVLSYNTAGQLRQINAVNSDGTTGAVQYKYAYRGDGKRAWKEDANGNRTFFYYDGEAMLAYSGEADFSARLVLWGPDGVVGQQWRNSNNTTGSQYFLYDAQGNLAQTIGGDGAVASSTYAFTAWGESVKNADGSQNTPGSFGYGAQFGYFRDGESGFYLCTYRHYDPSAGRWITRDPIEYGGGPNLYGYAWNDPANLSDPRGKFVPLLIGIFVVGYVLLDIQPANVPVSPTDPLYGRNEFYSPDVTEYGLTIMNKTFYGPLWKKQCPRVREGLRVHEGYHRSVDGILEQVNPQRYFDPSAAEYHAYAEEQHFLNRYNEIPRKDWKRDFPGSFERNKEIQYYFEHPNEM